MSFQVVSEPEFEVTKRLLASLPSRPGHLNANRCSESSDKIWVADPMLGRAWEEIQSKVTYHLCSLLSFARGLIPAPIPALQNGKIWLNHADKVVSRSHPSFLVPLPEGWKQRLDIGRQLVYVDNVR